MLAGRWLCPWPTRIVIPMTLLDDIVGVVVVGVVMARRHLRGF
jgi:hypothetical protein